MLDLDETKLSGEARRGAGDRIVVIEPRLIVRDCLMRCLSHDHDGVATDGYPTMAAWLSSASAVERSILILFTTCREETYAAIRDGSSLIREKDPAARIILISDLDDFEVIAAAFEQGFKAYIPATSNLDVVLAAIRLVQVGGTFVPASGIPWSRARFQRTAGERKGRKKRADKHTGSELTSRECEIIRHIRRGESNKVIALQLSISVHTVKMHLRSILKKIKARNRTEAAILASDLC